LKKNIAVIYGGDSEEWIISKKSAATVVKHLNTARYQVYLVYMRNNEWWVEEKGARLAKINRDDFSFEHQQRHVQFDYAFIEIHGTPGEDGILQAYFEMVNIPYSTPGVLVSAITFNKSTCIALLKQLGFHCSNSIVLRKKIPWKIEEVLKTVSTPCFVKPNNGGSSFGISKVIEKEALLAAIEKAFEHDNEIMIEELMVGREVTNGAYISQGEVHVMPVTEIISKNDFFDFQAKYEGASDEITPANLSSALTLVVQETTKSIYEKMNLKGIVRIDYILKNDLPYVIEVNTTPGLSEESLIPQQVAKMGITLETLFDTVIQESFR
jgi:D-alanine-D-alanine ligase